MIGPAIDCDVLVVGGGPAGLVVAQSALEANRSVTIVEAGPGTPMPPTVTGLNLVAASQLSSRLWPDLRVSDRIGSSTRPYRQARTVGGGSTVNGMVLSRGCSSDYQRWEQLHQCWGWGVEELVPWLDRAAARFKMNESGSGPLSDLVVDQAVADGLKPGGSTIDLDADGVLKVSLAAARQRRLTALDVCDVGGATMMSEVAVDRLVMEGRRVVGAELRDGRQLRASNVVLCAGALGTPAILQRSGIAESRVGGQILDHWSIAFDVVAAGETVGEGSLDVGAGPTSLVGSVIRFGSSTERFADIEVTVVERFDRPAAAHGVSLGNVIVALVQPRSIGHLFPNPAPRCDHWFTAVTNGLGHEDDRMAFRSGVRRVARWLNGLSSANRSLLASAGSRSAAHIAHLTDEELDRFLLATPGPVAHLGGSCPLGPESSPAAVCHHEPGRAGAVFGYEGLRVADSSILPGLVSGGLQLPVMAVADRVATDLFGST